MRIDLHTPLLGLRRHRETRPTLLETARRAGLDVVALTDHDTTAGWAGRRARRGRAVSPSSPAWSSPAGGSPPTSRRSACTCWPTCSIPRTPGWPRNGRGCATSGSSAASASSRRWSTTAIRCPGTRSSSGASGGVVGRPHIARALVEAGVVESVDDAFATLLHHRSPYYVAKVDTDVREGIALVRAAGGVPVFAHGLATKRGRVVGDDAIAAMVERRAARARGRPPRPLAGRTRPPARPGRRPRPDRHRVQRLPRHQQATSSAPARPTPTSSRRSSAAGSGSEPFRD